MTKKLQLNLKFDQDLSQYLKSLYPRMIDFRILSKGVDARRANKGRIPVCTYSVEIIESGEQFMSPEHNSFPLLSEKTKSDRPIIVGAGPAGLFCALRLAEFGVKGVLFERGAPAKKRMLDIAKFWRYGHLNSESNVCYGEGGAGLFSDGKLITRVKSPYIPYVMQKFVQFGAPAETAYLKDPHLGSNKIRKIITHITDYLQHKGWEIHTNTKVDEILLEDNCSISPSQQHILGRVTGIKLKDGRVFESSNVVLATGHSAKDIYYHLYEKNVAMKSKSFAVGVRIEHSREVMDQLQYGPFAGHSELGTAKYRWKDYDKDNKRACYSFCMCPGGYVLSSGTEKDGIVVNGMSNYSRHSPWSNSALVVTVEAGRDFPNKVLAGISYQQQIEKMAYEISKEYATGREVPAMSVTDFLAGKLSLSTNQLSKSSCPSGHFATDIRKLFPEYIVEQLQKSIVTFERQLPGMVSSKVNLLAPETRTSAPVTILRDKQTYESTSHRGLYPAGEGAGYAGGITSAAVDGVNVAMSILYGAYGLQEKMNF